MPPGRANRSGWYLYNRAPNIESIISHQPLEYNRYLNKLVAWAWFNGLLTSRTRLYIKGNGIVDCLSCRRWSPTCRTISAALTCTDTEGALQPV